MKEIISKELLCEVLGTGEIKGLISHYLSADERYIILQYDEFYDSINIYELANMCKEWAGLKGYQIKETYGFEMAWIEVGEHGRGFDLYFDRLDKPIIDPCDTFKVCQWIL